MKTTISESQLNRLITNSLKKVIKEGQILNESYQVNFTNLGTPNNNNTFNIENPTWQDGTPATLYRIPGSTSTYKNPVALLSKGGMRISKTTLWDILQKLGYTPEQLETGSRNGSITSPRTGQQTRMQGYATRQASRAGVFNQEQPTQPTEKTTTKASTKPEEKGAEPAGIQSGVNNWNTIGLIEQIRLIQRAVGLSGADADGRVGPQTTASIVRALINRNSNIVNELSQKNIGTQSFIDKNLQFTRGKKVSYNQPNQPINV